MCHSGGDCEALKGNMGLSEHEAVCCGGMNGGCVAAALMDRSVIGAAVILLIVRDSVLLVENNGSIGSGAARRCMLQRRLRLVRPCGQARQTDYCTYYVLFCSLVCCTA